MAFPVAPPPEEIVVRCGPFMGSPLPRRSPRSISVNVDPVSGIVTRPSGDRVDPTGISIQMMHVVHTLGKVLPDELAKPEVQEIIRRHHSFVLNTCEDDQNLFKQTGELGRMTIGEDPQRAPEEGRYLQRMAQHGAEVNDLLYGANPGGAVEMNAIVISSMSRNLGEYPDTNRFRIDFTRNGNNNVIRKVKSIQLGEAIMVKSESNIVRPRTLTFRARTSSGSAWSDTLTVSVDYVFVTSVSTLLTTLATAMSTAAGFTITPSLVDSLFVKFTCSDSGDHEIELFPDYPTYTPTLTLTAAQISTLQSDYIAGSLISILGFPPGTASAANSHTASGLFDLSGNSYLYVEVKVNGHAIGNLREATQSAMWGPFLGKMFLSTSPSSIAYVPSANPAIRHTYATPTDITSLEFILRQPPVGLNCPLYNTYHRDWSVTLYVTQVAE